MGKINLFLAENLFWLSWAVGYWAISEEQLALVI